MTDKELKKKRRREYYLAHKEQENANRKLWNKTHHAEQVERSSQYYAEHKEERDQYDKEYRESNRDKKRAHNAVRNALKSGLIVKPDTCESPDCSERAADAHHDSYDEDKQLDVIWLCRKHHKELHFGHRG